MMFLLLLKSFTKRSHLICVSLSLSLLIGLVNSNSNQDEISINRSTSNSCKSTESRISSTLLVGLLSSLVFSFIGILPAFFIRTDKDEEIFKNSLTFKFLLSFAAGSLIGDVFLHLIPEAFDGTDSEKTQNGLYSIFAFFVFLMIEKITGLIPNAHALGTLNLIANFFDNSAHGTTVVGAFEVSLTFGMIALVATVIHEVPHEFSDFALLLRDGYSRKKAICFQLITAMAGTFGATLSYLLTSNNNFNETCYLNPESSVLMMQNHSRSSLSVLPFTIGGFLYISLVGIVPEIVEEQDKKISILQMFSFLFGVLFIYCLVQIEHILPSLNV